METFAGRTELTLGPNESFYTAPANGWVRFNCSLSDNYEGYANVTNTNNGRAFAYNLVKTGQVARINVQVKKDDIFRVDYHGNLNIMSFSFLYDSMSAPQS